MVIWIIGISGAGKTTQGKMIQKYLDKNKIKNYLIDGDEVRDFFDNDLGYSSKDREINIKRILLSAYLLEKNGIVPIVCNISPYDELRVFAQKKFKKYIQIYLKKDINIASKSDVKGVYKRNLNKTDIIGIDEEFEKPSTKTFTIDVNKYNEKQTYKKIKNYLKESFESKL